MATRMCPNCGSQYVASVRRCIDCDVILVDEEAPVADDAGSSLSSPVAGGKLEYELEGWGNQLKVSLRGMLELAGIPAVWGTTLVVPAEFEEEVDQLIATVEGGEVVEELDEEGDRIAFEIEGLDVDELADLDARLIADHIAHAWDEEGALLVAVDDEETVAAIIDDVMSGPAEDEPDGLATQEALSDLFVAVDKLWKDPADKKLVARYVAATEAVVDLPVPYGLSGDDWRSLGNEAQALATLVRPEDPDEHEDEDETDEATDEQESPDTPDDADAEDEADTPGEADGEGNSPGEADGEADTPGEADSDDDEDEDEPLTPVEQARIAARELRERLQQLV